MVSAIHGCTKLDRVGGTVDDAWPDQDRRPPGLCVNPPQPRDKYAWSRRSPIGGVLPGNIRAILPADLHRQNQVTSLPRIGSKSLPKERNMDTSANLASLTSPQPGAGQQEWTPASTANGASTITSTTPE